MGPLRGFLWNNSRRLALDEQSGVIQGCAPEKSPVNPCPADIWTPCSPQAPCLQWVWDSLLDGRQALKSLDSRQMWPDACHPKQILVSWQLPKWMTVTGAMMSTMGSKSWIEESYKPTNQPPLKATDYIFYLGECLMEPGGRREWGDIHSHGNLFLNLHRSQLNLISLTSQSTLNNDYSLISETHIPKDRNFFD